MSFRKFFNKDARESFMADIRDSVRERFRGSSKATASFVPYQVDLARQKLFLETDQVIKECEDITSQISDDRPKSVMDKLKNISLTPKRGALVKKASLSNDTNQSISLQESLCQKLELAQRTMEEVVSNSIKERAVLKDQAEFLLLRVKACVKYNDEKIPQTKCVHDELFGLSSELEKWIRHTKAMLKFFNEVKRQKSTQIQFVSRAHHEASVNDKDEDPTVAALMSKLFSMKRLRKQVRVYISRVHTKQQTYETNLSDLNQSLTMLDKQLWKLTASPIVTKEATDPEFDDNNVGSMAREYNHDNCSDCQCVHAMSTECILQLHANVFEAEEGTRKLQKIIEIKRKMPSSPPIVV